MEGERWGSGAIAGCFQCAILAQNSLLASIVNQQLLYQIWHLMPGVIEKEPHTSNRIGGIP
jgi:hypothetical protein